jgi:hypothetical protein
VLNAWYSYANKSEEISSQIMLQGGSMVPGYDLQHLFDEKSRN